MLRLIAALVLVALALVGYAAQAGQQGCRTFAETRRTVCGRFLEYWDTHGGLPQQGYPISGEMTERSEVDGKTYTVQYFERAVFERHPENQPPYDVLLSLLGATALRERFPAGPPPPEPNATPGESAFFRETGKRVSGPFLAYWRTNGGLAQQGYPLTDAFYMSDSPNGPRRVVQYFERAVFEHHPENKPPYDVLLSRLGAQRYERLYGGASGTPATTASPSADPLAALRARPVRLPTVAAGSPCPVLPGRTVSPDFGPALGDGPLYPAGFGTEGVARLQGASEEGGWYYIKVLWVANPAYKGPALVRGGRIDAPGEVGFERGPDPARELALDPGAALSGGTTWPNWPTYTRVRAPGCYAYQIDGTTFTRTVVFRVE
jgi:hypothetical protein